MAKSIIPDSNSKIKVVEKAVKSSVSHPSFEVTKRCGGFLVKFRSNAFTSSEEQINEFLVGNFIQEQCWECTYPSDTTVWVNAESVES